MIEFVKYIENGDVGVREQLFQRMPTLRLRHMRNSRQEEDETVRIT